jgi:hypothetical protein
VLSLSIEIDFSPLEVKGAAAVSFTFSLGMILPSFMLMFALLSELIV